MKGKGTLGTWRYREPGQLLDAEPERVWTPGRNESIGEPKLEEVDVNQAQLLLQQVQQDWSNLGRKDLRELYQFDRLREICAQVKSVQF